MATHNVLVAHRQALMTALAARPNLAGVQVVYAYPGQMIEDEAMWSQGGDVQTEIAAMRAGRKTRNEDSTYEVVVSVQGLGQDQATVDARAMAIGAELEDYLADNPSAAELVAVGAYQTFLTGPRVFGGPNGENRFADLIYTVSYDARLT